MSNDKLIERFYTAFANSEAKVMASCYATKVTFEDPAFGVLDGQQVRDMWHMLIENSKGDLRISHQNVSSDQGSGSAQWTARYTFSKTGREVVNEIRADFEFENGKIVRHTDHFNLWKWSRQAMGWKGYLFGWTPFFQRQLQRTTSSLLRKYQAKKLADSEGG